MRVLTARMRAVSRWVHAPTGPAAHAPLAVYLHATGPLGFGAVPASWGGRDELTVTG
jgi:hypothetical protein